MTKLKDVPVLVCLLPVTPDGHDIAEITDVPGLLFVKLDRQDIETVTDVSVLLHVTPDRQHIAKVTKFVGTSTWETRQTRRSEDHSCDGTNCYL